MENTGFRAVYRSDKLFFFDPLSKQNLYKNLMREILTVSGSHIVKYAQETKKGVMDYFNSIIIINGISGDFHVHYGKPNFR